MIQGEGGNLFAKRAVKLDPGLLSKAYGFQVRNDDGLEHFRKIARLHKDLRFLLVYADPNLDDYGSYLLARGRVRKFKISDRQKSQVQTKHGWIDAEPDLTDELEAMWELMDIAEAHWALTTPK